MKPLLARARVVHHGVDIYCGYQHFAGITAAEAIHLYRSLRRNLRRIKRNARLWNERY